MSRRPARKVPAPLEAPLTPVALIGTALWLLATLGLLLSLDWLREHDALWWLWTSLVGAALGLIGLVYSVRHDARRRQSL
ncbi:MAG: DUF2530 domain-containing protein [Corynebacteriales bacterium]|nr:DUF2530 domain-containing protein [Mycobacteriales bacterium]